MRFRMVLAMAAVLVLGACGSGEAGGSTTQPEVTTSATTTVVDSVRAETDQIIQAWITAWMDEDVEGVVDLYAENGIYADTGCPFEMVGTPSIRNMVRGHLESATYTVAEPVETTYQDSGAVVQWIWGGTFEGEPFTMNPSTTFEIKDGLIIRSTDSYDRVDAPIAWEEACIAYAGG